MASTLRRVRSPRGSQVYRPEVRRRIIPARSINWWLMTSASAGVSFNVAINNWLARMGVSIPWLVAVMLDRCVERSA